MLEVEISVGLEVPLGCLSFPLCSCGSLVMSHLGDVDLSMPRALLGPGVGTAQGVLVKSPVAVFNHKAQEQCESPLRAPPELQGIILPHFVKYFMSLALLLCLCGLKGH